MKGEKKTPTKIVLVSYPKIVFLYPTFVVSLVAAIYLSIAQSPLDTASTEAIVISAVFLGVWATNLVVLAFNFLHTEDTVLPHRYERFSWRYYQTFLASACPKNQLV